MDRCKSISLVFPSIDAKGELRPDGYEWLEHPVGNGTWWYRASGASSWKKWDD